MPLRDIMLALLVPCILGFGFPISKLAMDSFPPILLNALRWSISGLVMCYFFPFPRKFIKQLMNEKLLTIRAAENVVRILPPLTVKIEEIKLAIKIIRKVCRNYK